MSEQSERKVLAELGIAPARQLVFLFALAALGILMIWQAIQSEAAIVSRALIVVLGLSLIFVADKIRRTPRISLLLTEEGLFQDNGEAVATWDQMVSIDRGALALKPSNGFTLLLVDKQPRAWVPGLWWRLGRRVGVGGTAYAGAAKFMAEQIALRLSPKR